MRTLYLRNVPDEVAGRLERLAAREGLSMSAFAVRELAEAARRAENESLVGDLPHLGLTAADALTDVERGRAAR